MTTDADPAPKGADGALYQPDGDPEGAAWVTWRLVRTQLFNQALGDLRTLRDGDRAIVQMQPHAGLGNMSGNLHGGAIMTLVDVAMFLGAQALGCRTALHGVTIDCNVQFVGGADLERPVDVVVEISRETGQFLFLRGLVEQGGGTIASFMGMLKKARR